MASKSNIFTNSRYFPTRDGQILKKRQLKRAIFSASKTALYELARAKKLGAHHRHVATGIEAQAQRHWDIGWENGWQNLPESMVW